MNAKPEIADGRSCPTSDIGVPGLLSRRNLLRIPDLRSQLQSDSVRFLSDDISHILRPCPVAYRRYRGCGFCGRLVSFYICPFQSRLFHRFLFLYDDSRLSLAQLLYRFGVRSSLGGVFRRRIGRRIPLAGTIVHLAVPSGLRAVGTAFGPAAASFSRWPPLQSPLAPPTITVVAIEHIFDYRDNILPDDIELFDLDRFRRLLAVCFRRLCGA